MAYRGPGRLALKGWWWMSWLPWRPSCERTGGHLFEPVSPECGGETCEAWRCHCTIGHSYHYSSCPEFICDHCGGTFPKGRSDAEAMAEARREAGSPRTPRADGRMSEGEWFSDDDSDKGAPEGFPWVAVLQLPGICLPLPMWHRTEAECDKFIREQVVTATIAAKPTITRESEHE